MRLLRQVRQPLLRLMTPPIMFRWMLVTSNGELDLVRNQSELGENDPHHLQDGMGDRCVLSQSGLSGKR